MCVAGEANYLKWVFVGWDVCYGGFEGAKLNKYIVKELNGKILEYINNYIIKLIKQDTKYINFTCTCVYICI